MLPATRVAARALDVGCGAGRHAIQLADAFDEVVAVDLSAPMIDLARSTRSRPNIDYRVGDLFDLTGHFDLVFSSAMLHHVDALDAALARIRSLVAPGGTAVLVDVVAPSSPLRGLPLRLAPRLMYRAGATLELFGDVIGRRPDAWSRYRLKTFPSWLDHLATDRFLTPGQFDAAYTAAFPGARCVDLGHLRAAVWQE